MERIRKWSTPIGALGIALLVGAFLLGIVEQNMRRDVLLLLAGLGIVLLAFYIITRPRDATRQSSNLRIASRGVNVLIVALAVIGIVAAVNYILNRQFSRRIDLTANHIHTLSEQTVQVLSTLQEPIQVTGFFTPATQQQREQADALLKDYQEKTDKLVVQMIDPDENPTLAQKYDNALPGTLVFEKGKRTEKVYNFDENTFTNAILKVTQTQQPAVYFTTGHGEYDPADFEAAGYGAIADFLKQVNYKIEPLNMATISDTLPADTRALVIAGPQRKFSDTDEKRIQDYLDKGGRVLLMTDPNTDVGLTNLLKNWGMEAQSNLILDPGQNYLGNLPIPVFVKFPSSPVTQKLSTLGIYLPGTHSLKTVEGSDKQLTALFTTTDVSCAKTDFKKLQEQGQAACADGDAKGPFVVGYAAEGAGGGGANPDQRARLIVLGNAAFASNRWMNSQDSLGNQQLFANMINWLAGQEALIAVPPRDPNLRPLSVMTESELGLVFWTSVLLIPLAALIVGGILWWRRR